MRLIDADDLLVKIDSTLKKICSHIPLKHLGLPAKIESIIAEQPTIEAEVVVHGHWIKTRDDNKKKCSNCEIIHMIAQYPHGKINYCPNCGAKMDENMAENGYNSNFVKVNKMVKKTKKEETK